MALVGFSFVGIVVGLGFSLVYAVAFLLMGGMPRPDGSIISPVAATAMYVVTCGAGGVIMGALRSLFRSGLGTALVGIIGMIPAFIGGAALYEGSFAGMSWSVVALCSILAGIPLGFGIRKEYRSLQEEFGFGGQSRD